MAFWDDVKGTLSQPLTYANPILGYSAHRSEGKDAEAEQKQQGFADERTQKLWKGMQYGRDKGADILGQDESATGGQIQDIMARRKANLDQPSAAAEEIRRKGHTMGKQVAQRGGSTALQAQMALSGSQQAAQTDQQYKDASLSNYQNLVGSILQNQMAIEPAYAKLFLASQYQAAPTESKGLFGGVLDGLGLM